MKKHSSTNSIISLLSVFLGLSLFTSVANATVGGPTYIHEFKYNPKDESVYYIQNDSGGRGCPPVLMKISLATGKSAVVYSCDQGEKLLSDGNYDSSRVYTEINTITSGFKDITPINLKKNNISIDIDFVESEKFPEIDEIVRSKFMATVYQDDKKITQLPLQGCNTEQPFTFAGYAIPGFDKKIILLLSTKGDCFEGGYTNESLLVSGGLHYVNKEYVNFYKYNSALIPHEGTLVLYEKDTVENTLPPIATEQAIEKDSSVFDNKLTLATIAFASLFVGFLLGRRVWKNNTFA